MVYTEKSYFSLPFHFSWGCFVFFSYSVPEANGLEPVFFITTVQLSFLFKCWAMHSAGMPVLEFTACDYQYDVFCSLLINDTGKKPIQLRFQPMLNHCLHNNTTAWTTNQLLFSFYCFISIEHLFFSVCLSLSRGIESHSCRYRSGSPVK